MKYLNQLEYEHIPYPTRTKEKAFAPHGKPTNVKTSGCGLCSVCMAIDLLTDTTLDIEECTRISMECSANHRGGTDMNVLAPVIAEKFCLEYTKTDNTDEAVAHLRSGGVVVVHVGVPKDKEIGLFTKGGHYMLIISTDGEEFCFLDPSYTPDKFDIPERVGRVNTINAPYLYCDLKTMESERKPGFVRYHMFKRIKKI